MIDDFWSFWYIVKFILNAYINFSISPRIPTANQGCNCDSYSGITYANSNIFKNEFSFPYYKQVKISYMCHC